ncbi:2-succinyl-6-hydroxy-2,4-cyclohexadiene-1-carboxylate synthase [Allocoleopsis sp.]|uniref:2-succinyl-6-hydroxy-2, 4-cyclohexadiene-1-carboxylate synthase n=1 Tax=Allocoleopsis sp. TaxID=3088169 RepID=UPI002FD428D3
MMFDNFKFHYSFRGNRAKPLILFLHGFMGDGNEFNEVISLLSDQFCSLTVDLPGHGKTRVLGDEECYMMSNTADAVINLLDQLNVKNCFLVGYSMGGRLALYLNLHFPQYFSKVVLESASPGLKTERDRLERIQRDFALSKKLEKGNLPTFLEKWYDQPLFASLKNHPKFDFLIESRLHNNPCMLAKSLRNLGLGCQPCLWENIKHNKNPLLLVVGEYDSKFIVINSDMARLCQSTTLEIVSSCGHNMHFEDPKTFVENVRLFFT